MQAIAVYIVNAIINIYKYSEVDLFKGEQIEKSVSHSW